MISSLNCALGGQLRKDALNLLLLLAWSSLSSLLAFTTPMGSMKKRARRRHVVHQAGHVVLVLRFDGHHEAVVALGDDGLLRYFAWLRRSLLRMSRTLEVARYAGMKPAQGRRRRRSRPPTMER